MLVQIKKTKSWFSDFWVGMVKNNGYSDVVTFCQTDIQLLANFCF